MFAIFVGLYVLYFYIEVFSVRRQIFSVAGQNLPKYLIVIMNVGSLFGRLVRLYPSKPSATANKLFTL